MPISLRTAIEQTNSAFEVKNNEAVAIYMKIAEQYNIQLDDAENKQVTKQYKANMLEALLNEGELYKAAILYTYLSGSNDEMERRKSMLMQAYLVAFSMKGRDENQIRRIIKTPLIDISRKDRRNHILSIQEHLPANAARLTCFNSFTQWCFSQKEKGSKSNGDHIVFDWANLLRDAFGLNSH